MAQEGFLRLAGVVRYMPAELFADRRLFGLRVSENRINNPGNLEAQGAKVGVDLGGPAVLLPQGAGE